MIPKSTRANKLLFLLGLIVVATSVYAEDTSESWSLLSFEGKMSMILDGYIRLVSDNARQDRPYFEAYRIFQDHLDSRKVGFLIDESRESTVFGGAAFTVYESGRIVISITRELIDLYPKHPSIVYSVLTHEIWHLRDYAQDPDWYQRALEDEFETLLYEKDATYIEALFIEEVLLPGGFELTPLEEYLHRTNSANQLSSFFIVVKATDTYVLDQMSQALIEYRQSGDRSAAYARLQHIGDQVLEGFGSLSSESSTFTEYARAVGVHTFNKFMTNFIGKVESGSSPVRTWGALFAEHPVLQTLYEQTGAIAKGQVEFIQSELNGWVRHFNLIP